MRSRTAPSSQGVIVPPAGSCGTAKERMDGQEAAVECVDWFCCTEDLSKADRDWTPAACYPSRSASAAGSRAHG